MEGNGKQSMEELLRQLVAEQKLTREELGARIDATNTKLDQTNTKLDQTCEELAALGERIDAVRTDLGERIDTVRTDLGGRIDGVKLEVVALRAMARADAREDQELRGRVDRIEQHLGIPR